MLFKTLLLAAAAVFPALARTTRNAPFDCGTPAMNGTELDRYNEILGQASRTSSSRSINRRASGPRINVYMHVVAANKTKTGGWIPESQIDLQMFVLRADFAYTGFEFQLAGLDYTINPTWAEGKQEYAMKKTLRKGTYKDLNIYFVRSLENPNTLGNCYYPQDGIERGSELWVVDSCTIRADVVAGAKTKDYDLGRTVVHEVGHWLGLRHTHEGGCEGNGDGIPDTPAEASPAFGCPKGRNTCPDTPGEDPIGNHMSYTSDGCKDDRNGFSLMQAVVMHINFNRARLGK